MLSVATLGIPLVFPTSDTSDTYEKGYGNHLRGENHVVRAKDTIIQRKAIEAEWALRRSSQYGLIP